MSSSPQPPTMQTLQAGITRQPFPASRKVYLAGKLPGVQVPFREVTLSPTSTRSGLEANAPILLYDTSGPYSDPGVEVDLRKGLPALRRDWILSRGDVETVPSSAPPSFGETPERFPGSGNRKVLRAKRGCNVTQMYYAKRGILTPEMEFVAVRENLSREDRLEKSGLSRQHVGESFGEWPGDPSGQPQPSRS